jgi:hypothetical protein
MVSSLFHSPHSSLCFAFVRCSTFAFFPFSGKEISVRHMIIMLLSCGHHAVSVQLLSNLSHFTHLYDNSYHYYVTGDHPNVALFNSVVISNNNMVAMRKERFNFKFDCVKSVALWQKFNVPTNNISSWSVSSWRAIFTRRVGNEHIKFDMPSRILKTNTFE